MNFSRDRNSSLISRLGLSPSSRATLQLKTMMEAAKLKQGWMVCDPLPLNFCDAWLPVTAEKAKKITACQPTLHMGMLSESITGCLKYYFQSKFVTEDGQDAWHYEHCSRSNAVVVREAGHVVFNVTTEYVGDGKDRVTAVTLGGNPMFTQEYVSQSRCRVADFRAECHEHMMLTGLATSCTKLSFVRGGKLLRGNVVLSRAHRSMLDRVRKAAPAHACSALCLCPFRGNDRALLRTARDVPLSIAL